MSKVQKNCKACGDIIEVRLADHRRGWGNFCDKACSAAYKCGQRPKDVNSYHAKFSSWASNCLRTFDAKYGIGNLPPQAPSIQSQVGKVKVKHKLHSPAPTKGCRSCGDEFKGYGSLCDKCEMHEDAMSDMEAGWDGHKVWTS